MHILKWICGFLDNSTENQPIIPNSVWMLYLMVEKGLLNREPARNLFSHWHMWYVTLAKSLSLARFNARIRRSALALPTPTLHKSAGVITLVPPTTAQPQWSGSSGCPQPLLSSKWFQTSGLHSHYPSSSSNAFQPQSGSRLFPIPAPSS